MRFVAVVVLFVVSQLVSATTPVPPSSLVGLWQFGGHTVWVKVNADGTALQCRVAPGGTIYQSEGRYVLPQSIHWQEIWETDEITSADGQITLHGKWGSFTYHRTTEAMNAACFSPQK
jgi:hypothetical protein